MTFCSAPFTQFELTQRLYTPCCSGWLASEVKPRVATYPNAIQAWNGPEMVRLRKSIIAGSFEYCQSCPYLRQGTVDTERKDTYEPHMRVPPQLVGIAVDPTCNLHCWSCRDKVIRKEPKRARRVISQVLRKWGPGIRDLRFQRGDAFASPLYRSVLSGMEPAAYPKLTVSVRTNGILIPRYWSKFPIREQIKSITISVDAATAETYERLRRGATWGQVQEALRFVSRLRESGPVQRLVLRFVTHADNFREMPAFVEMAEEFNADRVHFSLLRQWGLPQAEFDAVDLTRDSHPNREEFLELLDTSEELRNPKVTQGVFRTIVHDMIQG